MNLSNQIKSKLFIKLYKQNRKLINCFNNKKFSNSKKTIKILGIETSCDDTGIAIVDNHGNILGESLRSQHLTHLRHGGIIPTVARQLHRENITDVCEEALRSAHLRLRDVDAIATTVKPGLALSLLIGNNFGKYLAKLGNKPFIPIHHMEAHALTARISQKIEFPFLVLLMSGGHCLLALAKSPIDFYLLGSSIDDAPGEAFDKTARRLKMINLPEYKDLNGGAAMELAASKATNPRQFPFRLPLAHYRDCNFSFAGLKNAALKHIMRQERLFNITGDDTIPDIENFCAGFLLIIAKHVSQRTKRAMHYLDLYDMIPPDRRTLVISGGVASNNFIAKTLELTCNFMDYNLIRTPPRLCTDNGVMIAWNGVEKWNMNVDIIKDLNDIEQIEPQCKVPFGENWTKKIADENIKCSTLGTKEILNFSNTFL